MEETWQEKLSRWRTSSEKHWAWRNRVAKFLRKKVEEANEDKKVEETNEDK